MFATCATTAYIYAPGDLDYQKRKMPSIAQVKKKTKGKFIVIEGVDSAGKKTQAELLKARMEKNDIKVKLISFPQYDTPFGALVGKYLRGEYGDKHEIPPEIPPMLYAMDRYQFRDQIKSDLESGIYYISDRYTQSNLGYHAAKYQNAERDKFIKWIEQMESRMPQPDLVIFLHVPLEISQKLIKTRAQKSYLSGTTIDIHEQDIEYQKNVMETYLKIANSRDDWVIVNCVKAEEMQGKDEIHEEVAKAVEEKLGLREGTRD